LSSTLRSDASAAPLAPDARRERAAGSGPGSGHGGAAGHGSGHTAPPSLLHQPKAVWAVAFACVISFMGIGLVDPILPALASQLKASPSQVTMLFTSYLVVTAVAMLLTGFVSSRIGAKRTLVAGLAIIVVFAALAGASDTVAQIVGLRAHPSPTTAR
jgi:ACDE family multidrug resistance protein